MPSKILHRNEVSKPQKRERREGPSAQVGLLDVYYRVQEKPLHEAIVLVRKALGDVLAALVTEDQQGVKEQNRVYDMALQALWLFFEREEKTNLIEQYGELHQDTRKRLYDRYLRRLRSEDGTVPRRELLRLLISGDLQVPEGMEDDHRLPPLLGDDEKSDLFSQFRSLPSAEQHRLVSLYFKGRQKLRSWEFLKLVYDGHIDLPASFLDDARLGFDLVE